MDVVHTTLVPARRFSVLKLFAVPVLVKTEAVKLPVIVRCCAAQVTVPYVLPPGENSDATAAVKGLKPGVRFRVELPAEIVASGLTVTTDAPTVEAPRISDAPIPTSKVFKFWIATPAVLTVPVEKLIREKSELAPKLKAPANVHVVPAPPEKVSSAPNVVDDNGLPAQLTVKLPVGAAKLSDASPEILVPADHAMPPYIITESNWKRNVAVPAAWFHVRH
jgi:hypothetical protein